MILIFFFVTLIAAQQRSNNSGGIGSLQNFGTRGEEYKRELCFLTRRRFQPFVILSPNHYKLTFQMTLRKSYRQSLELYLAIAGLS